jgi:hypothetical protein
VLGWWWCECVWEWQGHALADDCNKVINRATVERVGALGMLKNSEREQNSEECIFLTSRGYWRVFTPREIALSQCFLFFVGST